MTGDPEVGLAPTAHSDRDPGTTSTVTSVTELGVDVTVPADAAAAPREEVPTTIGRYQVIRKLGAGGMGVVYAATDPELARTVAIKRVRERIGGVGSALRERLRREAQALARLAHPNVVSIHDVGVDADQLFIVMQYVDGALFDEWIAAHRLERDAIVALYVRAGRGLAAAYAAGLVHRDFKPGNVLVERDGTLRVTDFGLVRLSQLTDAPSIEGGASNAETVSGDALVTSMTQGDVIGTPAYMAPEQFLGAAVTPATDQFAFCVALWEALTGARPFEGRTLAAIRAAVSAGVVGAPARPLPRRLARALRRGLAVRPDDRFPSIDALLAALEPPRRRWLAAGAAALAVGGLAAGALARGGGARANPCAAAAADLDAVWPARRGEVRAALAAAAAEEPALVRDVERALDERAGRWRAMRIDACEATRVRHTEPDEVMARRVACLTDSLDGLRAALDLLTDDGARNLLTEARAIVHAGADARACTAAAALEAAPAATAPPALRARLADLEARFDASDFATVAHDGPALARELEAAGDARGAARAWLRVAMCSADLSNREVGDAARRAAALAARAGDAALESRAWAWTAWFAAAAARLDGMDDVLAMADAAAARAADPTLALEVEITRGEVADSRGDHDGAIRTCGAVLDRARAAPSPDADLLDDALLCVATAAQAARRFDEAAAALDELGALRRASAGPRSLTAIDVDLKRAYVRLARGDRDAGHAAFRAAIAALESIRGPYTIAMLDAWSDFAIAETDGGNISTPEGLAAAERAVELGRRLLAADDPEIARLQSILANVRFAAGDHAGAMSAYEAAMASYDHAGDLQHWAALAYNTADGYRVDGKCDRAVPLFERLVRLSDAGDVARALGPTARGGLGVCERMLGHYDAATTALQAAVTDLTALGEVDFAAQYRLELAEVAWARGDRREARRIAREVKASLADDTETHKGLRQMCDDWYLHPRAGLRAQ